MIAVFLIAWHDYHGVLWGIGVGADAAIYAGFEQFWCPFDLEKTFKQCFLLVSFGGDSTFFGTILYKHGRDNADTKESSKY